MDVIDGKLNRTKITECKIDTDLLEIIESAANAGHSKGAAFVREETAEEGDMVDDEAREGGGAGGEVEDRGDSQAPGDSSSSPLAIPQPNN